MADRDAYRAHAAKETSLPLFHQPWWLDATCGPDNWDAAMVVKGEEMHAALPFRVRRNRGFTILSQPFLTPYLGPWLKPTGAKRSKDLSRQKDLMTALIDQLPRHDHYVQNWRPEVTNWLPFHWKGFEQTTRYTYVLPNLSQQDALWSGFRENIKTDVRKAEGRSGIEMLEDASVDAVFALNERSFKRQGKTAPYDGDYLRRLDEACRAHGCGRAFIARDAEGRSHAGAYLVWDTDSAYYLVGGGDPELRNSGATSLCVWTAIRFAATVTRQFNFEGSMIESIERFFRAFGAEQIPYFTVTRTPSPLLRGALTLKSLVSR